MIGNHVSKYVLKQMTSLGITLVNFSDMELKQTLKDYLLDEKNMSDFFVKNINSITVEMKIEEYNKSLLYEHKLNSKRIDQQKNNINSLIRARNQVAWILITVYYCNFFIANEISKLYGKFIINFSKDDIKLIIKQSILDPSLNAQDLIENLTDSGSYSYQAKVTSSQYEGFVTLTLNKTASKPHLVVWSNLYDIFRKVSVDTSLNFHKDLLSDILTDNNRWALPSKIRNNWNYRFAQYYSEKGDDLGSNFLKIIESPTSAYSHFNKRTINPSEENITSSMAYLYHILNEVYLDINKVLMP